MSATAELHIDSKGFTWQFYNEDHHLLVEWSMKRDQQGGFRGTQKGEITDLLRLAQETQGQEFEALIERMEVDQEGTNPCDICDGLRDLEE